MKDNAQIALQQTYFNPTVWEQMKTMAEVFIQSRALPKGIQNAAQAMMVMQAGFEMGMKPMQSMQGMTIINGGVNPYGKEVVRRLRDHGWKIDYKESDTECTATVTKDKETYTDTFKFDDAVRSKWVYQYKKNPDGTLKKDANGNFITELKAGWYEGANRINKLRYGVISKIIKTRIPEVLGSAVDIAEVAEDYPVEEAEVVADNKPETPKDIVSPEKRPSLETFMEKEKQKQEEKKATVNTSKKQETPKTREEDLKEKEEKLTDEVKEDKKNG